MSFALRAFPLVLVLGFALAPAAPAQSVTTREVVIALMDDYPAFDANVAARHPRARPLAAVVLRSTASRRGNGPAAILLNPRTADVQVLTRALNALARCPNAGGTPVRDYVPIFAAPETNASNESDRSERSAWLRTLTQKTPEDVRWLGGTMGRTLKISGIRVCAMTNTSSNVAGR